MAQTEQEAVGGGRAALAEAAGAAAALRPIVVVGSANADLFLHTRLPRPGETVAATGGGDLLPGGKGANQAAAAALLLGGGGGGAQLVCQTGADDAGSRLLRGALAAAGVCLDHAAAVPGCATGTAVILLQPGGENSIVILAGANGAWASPSPGALAAVRLAALLLLQREVPEPVSLAAAEAAACAGVPVVLDFGGDDAFGPPCARLLAACMVVSPNETELGRATGLPTESDDEVEAAARCLLQPMPGCSAGDGPAAAGPFAVLVKLGARGSVLVTHGGGGGGAGGVVRCPAFSVPRVVDTTGAGDCFTAAFGVALVEAAAAAAGGGGGGGRAAAEAVLAAPGAAARCLRFASAAASLCVQRAGAMPSLPGRAEVDALLLRERGA